jgi:hypothetical protein
VVAGVLVDESFAPGGAEVAERTVQPAGVIPALYPVEHGPVQAGDGRPGPAVDELPFDGGKEALSYRVVPAFPFAAERQDYPVFFSQVAEIVAGVLTAAVGFKAEFGLTPINSRFELSRGLRGWPGQGGLVG